jgi:HlyD family secretion protein
MVALISVAVLALLFAAYRHWQGPKVPGYRIEARPLVQTVVATGRVVAVSRAQVGSEITGVVVERRVKEGDTVVPGDVLVVLRSDQLSAQVREAEAVLDQLRRSARPQAAVALRQAEVQLEQARREAERRRELFKRQAISGEDAEQAEQAEALARAAVDKARLAVASLAPGKSEEAVVLERLKAARAALAKSIVRSEVSGTVLTRNAEPGDLVQPGRVLFEIARSGDTELLVPLDEKNLGVLSLGQLAQCVADAFPARTFTARVSFIAPGVDTQRGSVDIRLKVDPVPAFLRQDMTVSVNIETGRRAQALVVPNDALTDVQGDRARLAAVRNGKVQNVEVTLGLRGLAMSEIVSGARQGDQVIMNAANTSKDGDRVRLIEQALPDIANTSMRNELPVKLN